jgi:hypothetical protein
MYKIKKVRGINKMNEYICKFCKEKFHSKANMGKHLMGKHFDKMVISKELVFTKNKTVKKPIVKKNAKKFIIAK